MSDPFDLSRDHIPGRVDRVAPGVRRITCGNPSKMTFTGTQSYVVGEGRVAVIDPGPADADHVDALLDALAPGERVERIVVTHSHRDHSPGARLLARRTGAPVVGFGPHGRGMSATMQKLAGEGLAGGGEGADPDFAPEVEVADGERIEGAGWSLEVLHTPGHLSNHISLALGDVLFTGDTVMGWATTLVSPPEGDMGQFMASLERLSARSDRLYLPGHGNPVRDPAGMVRWQRRHRKERFDQILAALGDGPADAATLAARIYAEIDRALLPAAARNVFASLIALAEGDAVASRGPIAADAEFVLK